MVSEIEGNCRNFLLSTEPLTLKTAIIPTNIGSRLNVSSLYADRFYKVAKDQGIILESWRSHSKGILCSEHGIIVTYHYHLCPKVPASECVWAKEQQHFHSCRIMHKMLNSITWAEVSVSDWVLLSFNPLLWFSIPPVDQSYSSLSIIFQQAAVKQLWEDRLCTTCPVKQLYLFISLSKQTWPKKSECWT